MCVFFFFFKQKTAYEMRISDWSSDVCSSDLPVAAQLREALQASFDIIARLAFADDVDPEPVEDEEIEAARRLGQRVLMETAALFRTRSEERRVGKEGVSRCRYRGLPDL